MTLINTEGLSFIGPGSEWFWTALTGFVLAITFLGIYRQVRLQAHASAIEQLTEFRREAYSEQMLRYGLDVMVSRSATTTTRLTCQTPPSLDSGTTGRTWPSWPGPAIET